MHSKQVVLAEYFATEHSTELFIVRADLREPRVIEIRTSLGEIRRFVNDHFSTRDGGGRVCDLDWAEWQALFGPFVEPILPWANEGDLIWLVPHNVLHYVPLHAAKVEGDYLIERNPVCYAPSASVMRYCHARRKPSAEWGGQALVLGDPDGTLRHSRSEAYAIAELLGVEPHVGPDATKSLVTEALGDRERCQAIDIVHFSCHGHFDRDQPLLSGVQLADELLTAEDFLGLPMRADLVALSACESGVSERRPGDELIGLMRALIYAGTPSVILSLWEVDDASTELLMTRFYELRAQGNSKAEALRKAQQEVRRMSAQGVIEHYDALIRRLDPIRDAVRIRLAESGQRSVKRRLCALEHRLHYRPGLEYCLYDDPFHWAPFLLIGDWR